MKQCKAKMVTRDDPHYKPGDRCKQNATHGDHCWVHAQKFNPAKLPPAEKLRQLPRVITVAILGDVR